MIEQYIAKAANSAMSMAPKMAKLPLAIVPFSIKAEVISRLLKQLFTEQAEDDECDFLNDKWVAVNIADLQLAFEVSYQHHKWLVRPCQSAQVTFGANSAELILIAAAKEDPDTLFFQRKLTIEGDTELGLEVKNLLLSVEFDKLPNMIKFSISKLAESLMLLQQKAVVC